MARRYLQTSATPPATAGGATSLATTTSPVSLASAVAPTSGRVLTALSAVAANWQVPSGAFWLNPTGKTTLTFNMGAPGDFGQASGIILNPTAAVWSTFPWRWEAIESAPGYQLAASLYTGFITFSNIAGTPNVRFGTGVGDPGYSANTNPDTLQVFGYNRSTSGQVLLAQTGAANRPISIALSGEISLYYTNNGGGTSFAKGVFTVGPEVILPNPP